MTTPCKDCERRVIGCHASCEDYIGWKKQKMDLSEMKKNKTMGDNAIDLINWERHLKRIKKYKKP